MPASSTLHSTHRWGAGSSLPKALGDKCLPTPTQPDQTSADLREQQSILDIAQASPALMRRSFYDVETTIKLASTINGPQQKCCWKEMCSRSDLQIISLNCKVLVILPTFTDNKKAISLPPTPIWVQSFFFIINFLEWKISNKYNSRKIVQLPSSSPHAVLTAINSWTTLFHLYPFLLSPSKLFESKSQHHTISSVNSQYIDIKIKG